VNAALEPRVASCLHDVLARHPCVESALLFGSRAKGTARASSDVDRALAGNVSPLELARITGELEELPLPIRFDVHALERRDHLARVGVRVYARA
jgi:predicted nucleotidyltransferase